MKRIGSAVLATMAVLLLLAAAWITSASSASAGEGPTVAVSSATMAVGEEGTVELSALDIEPPGLGAWSINVVYDPAILEERGCAAQNGSVCNSNYSADTVRVAGATAEGQEGDTALASLGFRCLTTGTSVLAITVDTLADGTIGDPQDISAAVQDGSLTCVAEEATATPSALDATALPATPTTVAATGPSSGGNLPTAGSGPGIIDPRSPMTWIVALIAGAGLAWLSAGLAGAGLAAVASGPGEQRRSIGRGFAPRMRPVGQSGQTDLLPPENKQRESTAARRAHTSGHTTETPVTTPPRRTMPQIEPTAIGEFTAPKRPDRP